MTTWFGVGRMADHYDIPMPRVRFVRDGDSFDAGDRTFTAVRPPLFDNPVTRGLFDDKTGVYWSVDTFAIPVPHPVEELSHLDQRDVEEGLQLGARLISPWHAWLDPGKWNAHVDRVQALPIETIASCHAPVIRAPNVDRAFEILRTTPELAPWQEFGQDDLDAWMSAAGVASSS
ncbi:MAG: hypothetical protein H0V49_10185 [Nocardioidaceae bacterium]|nr:hypothetical protein [Nocardioidaceae bacterium]